MDTEMGSPLSLASTKPAIPVQERPNFELRQIPTLAEPQQQQALILAEKLDITKPKQVLSFGESVQSQVAEFSESLLANTSIAESGKVGELLLALKSQIEKIDPEELKGPQTSFGKLLSLIGFGPDAKERTDALVLKHENIKPVLATIAESLGVEAEHVGIALEQLSEIEEQNAAYLQSLGVVKTALTMRYNQAVGDFKQRQASTDISQVSETRDRWETLQRMDRRLYALEASLALGYSSETQIDRMRDMLTYNLETISEAKQIMLPAWRTKIGLAITALKAKDQAEMMDAFRSLTDELLGGTADTLSQIEVLQSNMQKRTFASAEVIAKINHQLADSINTALERQKEAKVARDAGIKLMQESQELVVQAMKRSNEALLGSNILDTAPSIKSYDIAAGLLEETVLKAPVAANGK